MSSSDEELAAMEQEEQALADLVEELRQFEPEATSAEPVEESVVDAMGDSPPVHDEPEVVLQPSPSDPLSSDLKRLQFVAPTLQRAQSLSLECMRSSWETLRSRAPKVAESLEARGMSAQSYVAPYASTALSYRPQLQEYAAGWLRWSDTQLDAVLTVAEARAAELAAARKRATALMHEAHRDGVRASLDKYMTNMLLMAEHVMEQLRVREHAAKLQAGVAAAVASAREALASGVVRARAIADPSTAAASAAAAWGSFVSTPAVARLLEAASPATKAGLARLAAAHDALVAAPLYSKAVATGASSLEYAATTTPYKLGEKYLRPYCPEVLTQVAESKALAQVVDYFRPVAPPAPTMAPPAPTMAAPAVSAY
ncbi:hypothetical protein FOA52_011214 [Chlamydomonas sp. UWO 241]|nr:hypothetical protein FOA52_011214 [Chlamydomonas sp. UWO 241]